MKSYPIVNLGGAAAAETTTQPVVAKNAKPQRPSEDAAKVKLAIQPISERFPALEEQEITLTYFAPLAMEVNVAGNFNGWRPDAAPLKNTGAGEWVVRLMLSSGQYEYRFVVDGRWIEDPQAQRMANPHGGFNSVLTVPLSVRTSIL
jgi:1,4-alpha-glucan branching enzyme